MTAKRRTGFTLIEVLVVIAIIAILAGIIIPATQSAREAATRARAANEINQLSAAVANAKDHMQARYVPSHAIVRSSFDLTPHVPPTSINPNFQANNEALNNLRQFFGGRFGRPSPNNPNIILTGLPDWGEIRGAECLVFFLGGYRDGNFGGGFGDDATRPFYTTSGSMVPRTWYDFPVNRLWVNGNGYPPVFADAWSSQNRVSPYFYFSTRRGGDYADATRVYNRNGVCWIPSGTYRNLGTGATIDFPVAVASMPLIDSLNRPVNQNGYQIVSAGKDGLFGSGGSWRPGSGSYAPGQPGFDDYTNFSKGPLGVE